MKKLSVLFIFILLAAIASFALPSFGFQGSMQQPSSPQPNSTMGQAPGQTPQQPSNPPPSSLPQSSRPQDQTSQAPQEQAQHPATPPSIDDQVKMLAADLNLTDDQQSKIKTILQDQREHGMKIAQDPALPRDEKISKIHDLRANTISQVRATLTSDEQRQKFDAMVKAQEQKMQQMEQEQRSKPESPK